MRFWTYFVAALQSIEAVEGAPSLAMLRSSQPPPVEALLAGLINQIAATSAPFVLVLDDFHVIGEQQVYAAVTFLLDHLPPLMHVVLSSRSDPPWPLARLRARREMTELRANDLRFTSGEASAFLNGVMGLGLSAQDVAALDARTEGWIAGLQMVALSMRGRAAQPSGIRTLPGRAATTWGFVAPSRSADLRSSRTGVYAVWYNSRSTLADDELETKHP